LLFAVFPTRVGVNRCLIVGVVGGGGFLIYWLVAGRPKQQLQKKGEQLVGKWSATVQQRPGRVFVYEFRKDGGFVLTGSQPGVATITSSGSWEVLSSKGNTLRVRMVVEHEKVVDARGTVVPEFTAEKKRDDKKDFEWLSKDRFRYTTSNGLVVEATRVP
jgi:hypothetical protein